MVRNLLRILGITTLAIGGATAIGYGVTAIVNDKPLCDIAIYPNGTWEPIGWRIETGYPNPTCEMPTWAQFWEDGSWSAIEGRW